MMISEYSHNHSTNYSVDTLQILNEDNNLLITNIKFLEVSTCKKNVAKRFICFNLFTSDTSTVLINAFYY